MDGYDGIGFQVGGDGFTAGWDGTGWYGMVGTDGCDRGTVSTV